MYNNNYNFFLSAFVNSEVAMSDALVNLNNAGWRPEEKALAEACNKFAIVIREHSQLLDTLVSIFNK